MNWLCCAIESVARAQRHSLVAGECSGDQTARLRRQVGDGVLPPRGMHRHNTPEICIALAGLAAMHVGHLVYAFSPPQIAILPAGILHAEGFRKASARYAVLWLHACSDSSLISVVSEYVPKTGWQCSERYALKSRAVRDLLRKIAGDAITLDDHFEALRADLLSILAAMNRQRNAIRPEPLRPAAGDANHLRLLKRVQEFLDNNYKKTIDVGSIAMLARFSPNYLNNLFSQWKGQGIREYLIARRMNHAMDLCRRGRFLVKEVSSEMGYRDPFYFSRAFHRYHGCWPSEVAADDR